ncbi:MAG: hypothetical protein ACFCUN_08390, partial [Hyphomicrobiaceae bacterium]
ADRLRQFATFRYLYYETGLYLHLRSWISRYFWGGEEEWRPEFISSAVDIRKINDHDSNRFFARYVFEQMAALSEHHGFRLVFVMDGVREAIYEGRAPMDYEVGRLNRIAREETARLGLSFIDLHDRFAADYAKHGLRFEFPFDWHWNARATAIVAEAVVPLVLKGARQSPSQVTPGQTDAMPGIPSRRPRGPRSG